MSFEGGHFSRGPGRFVPEPTLAPPDRSGGGHDRKNKHKKRKPKPERREAPKPRPIESAFESYSHQMRNILANTLSRNAGVLQIRFRMHKTMPAGDEAGRLLLDVQSLACKKGTDARSLLKEYEARLNQSIQIRNGENIRLFTETEKTQVEVIGPKDEARFENQRHLVDATKEPLLPEKPAEVSPEAAAQTPSKTLQLMRRVFLGHRDVPPRPLDRLVAMGTRYAKDYMKRRKGPLGDLPDSLGALNRDIARDLMAYHALKGEHDAVRQELSAAREKLRTLEKELATEIREKAGDIARLKTEKDILEKRVKSLDDSQQERDKKLTASITKLTEDLSVERTRAQELSQKLTEAQRNGTATQSDLDIAKAQQKILEEQLEHMKGVMSGTGFLDSAYKEALERLGREKAALELQLETSKAASDDRSESEKALTRATEQIGVLTAERDSLREQVKKLGGALTDASEINKVPENKETQGLRIEIAKKIDTIFSILPSIKRDEVFKELVAVMREATKVLSAEDNSSKERLLTIVSALAEIESTLDEAASDSAKDSPASSGENAKEAS